MPVWYYDKKELKNSPSTLSGLSYEDETRYRREGARFIQELGKALGLRHDTMATAAVYFHRFYMFHSFIEFPRYVTATCALFLAGKAEETPKKGRDIIKTVKELLNPNQFSTFGQDPREEVMTLERVLLQTIKFDLQVDHPYPSILKYAKCLKGDQSKLQKMVQMSWTFVNDSLCTTLCLQWEPEVIAIALMYLAAKLSKFEVRDWNSRTSDHRYWWDQYVKDVSQDILEDICHQVLDLYSTPATCARDAPPSPPPGTRVYQPPPQPRPSTRSTPAVASPALPVKPPQPKPNPPSGLPPSAAPPAVPPQFQLTASQIAGYQSFYQQSGGFAMQGQSYASVAAASYTAPPPTSYPPPAAGPPPSRPPANGPPPEYRNNHPPSRLPPDTRGPPPDNRAPPLIDARGPPPLDRGYHSEARVPPHDIRGPPPDLRGPPPEFRGGKPEPRGAQNDFRNHGSRDPGLRGGPTTPMGDKFFRNSGTPVRDNMPRPPLGMTPSPRLPHMSSNPLGGAPPRGPPGHIPFRGRGGPPPSRPSPYSRPPRPGGQWSR
ncbi:cyclin-K isoform X2 [Eurytemora carolleeae]|uniref:cyclin-K isoform X2 n=1 Tax=Eurytemora carolleeae TaxID=1294199 RepID=UPI000C77F2C1|nr:cyclin-K isoform X2 [Eurytemora carolleeae]|eukprot:XP_023323573.1 cyclin-K-like isoform X2 [Eurytemora affinis]